MGTFYIHMSDETRYMVRANDLGGVLDMIEAARKDNNGFLEVRIPETLKYVMINTSEITSIEEEDYY